MNRKGFTVLELLCMLAIIAITVAVLFSQSNDAYGADLQTLLIPSDAVIEDIASSIKNDPDQNVVVIVYSAIWDAGDFTAIDKYMIEMRRIINRLHQLGVPEYQIKMLLANKGGLEQDLTPIPASNGVYLYLE